MILARNQATGCLEMFSLFRFELHVAIFLRKISWYTQVHASLKYGYLYAYHFK